MATIGKGISNLQNRCARPGRCRSSGQTVVYINLGHRKIGTLGKDFGRCRKVQKRVLGGEGLTRVGWDGFGSSLDAELRFCEVAF